MHVTLEQRALVTALSAGASWSDAARLAADATTGAGLRAAWLRAAEASDPRTAIEEARLLPPFFLLVLRTDGGPSLAARADALGTVMRPWPGFAQLTVGAGSLMSTAVVGLMVDRVLAIFVAPVFTKLNVESIPGPPAAPLFLLALVLVVLALMQRGGVRSTWLMPRRSAAEGLARLFSSSAHGGLTDEVAALRSLAVCDATETSAHEALTLLARTARLPRLLRYARCAEPDMSPAAVVRAWAEAKLLSPPVARALPGLLTASRPLERMARLAHRAPSRAASMERALLSGATVAAVGGAALMIQPLYASVVRLGAGL